MYSHADLTLIDELSKEMNQQTNDREKLDCLIDILSEYKVFINHLDSKPCFYASYGTVIDWRQLNVALANDKINWLEYCRVFDEYAYTPLIKIISTYIKLQNKLV